MKWTEIPAGDVNSAVQKMLGSFGHYAERIVDLVKEDDSFVSEIAHHAKMKSVWRPTPEQARAQSIMGDNFFGPCDAVNCFGIEPPVTQLDYLSNIQTAGGRAIREDELVSCRDSHVLVALFPLSVKDIFSRTYKKRGVWFNGQHTDNFEESSCVKKRADVGWYLMEKKPHPRTFGKNFNQLQDMLLAGDNDLEMVSVQLMVYALSGFFLKTKKWLFDDTFVFCNDLSDSSGAHVITGQKDGLFVNYYWDTRALAKLATIFVKK